MYSGNDALSAGLRSDSIFTTGQFFAIASVMISVVSIIILVMAMFITCCCSASTLKYAVGTLYMLTFLCQCIAFMGILPVGLGAVASALYWIAFLLAFVMPYQDDPVCAERCCTEPCSCCRLSCSKGGATDEEEGAAATAASSATVEGSGKGGIVEEEVGPGAAVAVAVAGGGAFFHVFIVLYLVFYTNNKL